LGKSSDFNFNAGTPFSPKNLSHQPSSTEDKQRSKDDTEGLKASFGSVHGETL